MQENSINNQELKNSEEVKKMNDSQVQENKGQNVLSNEKVKSVAESIVAVVGTTNDINKRLNIIDYLWKDINKVHKDLEWNKKLNWTKKQKKLLYEEVKEEVEKTIKQVKTVALMVKTEKEAGEIQQQLKETPVANITVEFAEKGQFSIVNTQTKQVITTNTADVIKSTIAVMSKMKLGDTSASATENDANNNQV